MSEMISNETFEVYQTKVESCRAVVLWIRTDVKRKLLLHVSKEDWQTLSESMRSPQGERSKVTVRDWKLEIDDYYRNAYVYEITVDMSTVEHLALALPGYTRGPAQVYSAPVQPPTFPGGRAEQ